MYICMGLYAFYREFQGQTSVPFDCQSSAGSTANTWAGAVKFCIRSIWVTAFLLQSKLFAKLASGARGPVALSMAS